MKAILSPQGYLIATAKNGKSAIAKAKAHKFDLILLDIVLSDVDGFEVCTHLKSHPQTQDIPIVILTAKNDMEIIARGFQLGAADYISKPFSKEELVARVDLHLTLRKTQEELSLLKGIVKAERGAKSTFLANKSLEFRTSMEGMVAIVDHLKLAPLTDEQLESLSMIEQSSQNMLAIINSMLVSDKLEETQADPSPLKFKILLAEDNLIVQKVVAMNLEKLGHQVSVVPDGLKAVESYKNQVFDMIFMDIQMPQMDGLQATIAIRQWEKGSRLKNPIPIVAMTASTQQKDKDGFMAAGMNDYLSKPFNTEELTLVLDRVGRRLKRKYSR